MNHFLGKSLELEHEVEKQSLIAKMNICVERDRKIFLNEGGCFGEAPYGECSLPDVLVGGNTSDAADSHFYSGDSIFLEMSTMSSSHSEYLNFSFVNCIVNLLNSEIWNWACLPFCWLLPILLSWMIL